MTIQQIDHAIEQLENARRASRDPVERAQCEEAIFNLMQERMELTRARAERELNKGAREHSAWYDTSAELN
jgi:hypothetical protein